MKYNKTILLAMLFLVSIQARSQTFEEKYNKAPGFVSAEKYNRLCKVNKITYRSLQLAGSAIIIHESFQEKQDINVVFLGAAVFGVGFIMNLHHVRLNERLLLACNTSEITIKYQFQLKNK